MISIRDHIITLIAIFLTLALGILIGISLSDSLLVENQKQAIAELEARLQQQQSELKSLHRQEQQYEAALENWQSLADSLSPYLVSRGLEGKLLGIVYLGQSGWEEVVQIVAESGGEVARLIQVDYQQGEDTLEVVAEKDEFCRWLAECIQGEDLLPPAGFRVSYQGGGQPGIVLVGGEAASTGLPLLIEAAYCLKQKGLQVIGFSLGDSQDFLHGLEQKGLPTVGRLNSFCGRLSLMEVVKKGKGNYGSVGVFPCRWTFLEE